MDDAAKEIQALYRRYAGLRQRAQEAALRSVPQALVMEHARRLGLAVGGGDEAQVPEGDLLFAFDLAIFTAPPGRSRPIDRIARTQGRSALGEMVEVLRALEATWFSVFRVLGRHPLAGWILEDALLGGEVWVVDEGLAEDGVADDALVAMRVARVRGFAITTGMVAPLDEEQLGGLRVVLSRAGVEAAEMVADPRFATAIYRQALGSSVGDSLRRG